MARAKKARRQQRPEPDAAAVAARPERFPRIAKLLLAGLAVVAVFAWIRFQAPQPWSYDEYYHLGVAREMRSDFRMETFRWTPFSTLYDRFVDGAPLFHVLLMPFATLPLETAGLLGVILGQVFVVAALAWVLWALKAPQPWWFVLALPALGPFFVQRLEMCRPQVWLIGFAMLVIGLLAGRWWKALAVVCALFGLTHVGGWIAVPMAVLWSLSGLVVRGEPDGRRVPWQPVAAAAGGWLLGQLVHPQVPENFRLFFVSNFVIPFQAAGGGDAALRTQLGTELTPLGAGLLADQWPAFIAPLLVAAALLLVPRVRSRATLTGGLMALAFFGAGCFFARRFFELGAPLAILALALIAREWRDRDLVPQPWLRWAAGIAIAVGALWTVSAVRTLGFGQLSPPRTMAEWLGENGKPGERVFTAQWADSSPLFYAAPQLQSLVALDPTNFYRKDPRLFAAYMAVIEGRDPDPARTIRERFGARWVAIWRQPAYQQLAYQLNASPGTRIVFNDADYVIMDLEAR